jgi:hypothetical protein
MGGMKDVHVRAQETHARAAKLHEDAARYWERLRNHERAAHQRMQARKNREGEQLERERAAARSAL